MKDNEHLKRIEKINFIRKNVPNYEKINPYSDGGAIDEIKKLLWMNGFYKNPQYSSIMDSVIIRLLLMAQKKQNEVKYNTSSKTCNRKDFPTRRNIPGLLK